MGCLAIIIAWLLGGFIYGVIIWAVWNIVAAIVGVTSITFGLAFVIGMVLMVVLPSNKN